jgi:molybdopterin/thiamine biosynthesis adenylyltransferase
MDTDNTVKRGRGKHVLVVGAGGNIGSHLVPHLARMPGVARVSLVDRGRYQSGNLRGQSISERDVGKWKARVQAARLRAIRSGLTVSALCEPVERLALGRLRVDVVLACLDSRRARQTVNQAALFLGVAWIDSGVKGDDSLARVNFYRPGSNNPCLECAWDERDYRDLEQDYPCLGGVTTPPSTGAASSLGALAASLQAIECTKLLEGRDEPGLQVLVDAAHHKLLVTRFQRNPDCRIGTHEARRIRALDVGADELTLGEALGLGRYRLESTSLRVEGKSFVRALMCGACTRRRKDLRLVANGAAYSRTCRRCRGSMTAPGFDVVDSIEGSTLSSRWLARSLRTLGFRDREVFTVSSRAKEKHFELGAKKN